MTLQQLRLFLRLCEVGTISKVADLEGLTQPTVTFHMRALERELAVSLFAAKRPPFVPTAAGEALLHYARRMTGLYTEACREMDGFRRNDRCGLSVGASLLPATWVLPPIIEQLKALGQSVHLRLHCLPSPTVLGLVHSREVDIGLIIGNPIRDSHLHVQQLFWDEMGLVARVQDNPSSWLRAPISAHDIAAVPVIVQPSGSSSRQALDDWMRKYETQLDVQMELESLEVIRQLVKSGIGYALISALAAQQDRERGQLAFTPLREPPRRLLQIVYQRDHALSESMQRFLSAAQLVAPGSNPSCEG
jgi:DNA-binding transcriptional LysR family regulator